MAMVFQGYALWPHMNVSQNVAFGLEMRRLQRTEIKRQLDWVLGVVNLRGMEQRYPHELSGGQQQRVALARALVVRPGTLLLDEPLSNLDANLREQMRFEIRRVHQETGITMVYVTHDQAEALVIADRIAVMNVGQVEQIGSPREIYEQPLSRFAATFIGQANCLSARAVEPGVVSVDGAHFTVSIRLASTLGDDVTLAIRPSAVCILTDGASTYASRCLAAARCARWRRAVWQFSPAPTRFSTSLRKTVASSATDLQCVNPHPRRGSPLGARASLALRRRVLGRSRG
jgi:ABC-type Fe3+/spermidine/putrescine transport system ATPase subunit